jgi:hypothetical protein
VLISVTATQISQITDSSTIGPFVTQIRNLREYFKLDDTHVSTGDTTFAQVIENIILEFGFELPLILNIRPVPIADSIVETFDIPVSPLDFSVLDCFDPIHRRIDLQSFPVCETFFNILLPFD